MANFNVSSLETLKQDLEAVKTFQPLTGKQVADLFARTAQAASRGKFEGFKAPNAFDGTAKNPSWLGEEDKGPAYCKAYPCQEGKDENRDHRQRQRCVRIG